MTDTLNNTVDEATTEETDPKAVLTIRKSISKEDDTVESDETIILPNPQTLQWDLVDKEAENCSGYNQDGEYFRDVIGQKVTISVSWGALSKEEMSSLIEAISDDSFELEYPDAKTGKRERITAYVSSKTAPMYCYNGEDSWQWQGLSITFIER